MTDIILAGQQHQALVGDIVHQTISAVYPNYYPAGAVEYFLKHHSPERIRHAIGLREVYLIVCDGDYAGTGSIKGNEICRLFILPQFQGRGLGTRMMDAFEETIFSGYSEAQVSASLPAYEMYRNRGYLPLSYHRILTENGHYLCYHQMVKDNDVSKTV